MNTHVLKGAFYTLQYDVLNDFACIIPVNYAASEVTYVGGTRSDTVSNPPSLISGRRT
jgi:hypothetical protein